MEDQTPKSTRHSERRAFTFALMAVLLWSTVATGFKLALTQLSVTQLLLMATTLSWLIFAVFCAWRGAWRIEPNERRLIVVLGLINPLLYYLVLFAAYDRLPAHIAQPLNYTWAITLALLAVPILKQPLSRRMMSGITLSYLGVVVLLLSAAQHEHKVWQWLGVILALASTVLWAVYWLLSARCRSEPAPIMFWSFSVALPPLLLICLATEGLPKLTGETLLYGAWVGCIEMGITFLLWQQALRLTRQAARIGQLIFLSPFISLLIIQQVLGEQIGAGAVAALALIVAGLTITRPPAAAPSG